MIIKKFKETAKNPLWLSHFSITFAVFILTKHSFYAAATELGRNIESTSGKLLSEIKAIYCGSLCWLLLAINICILFFSKDDKMISFSKKAIFGCIIAYAALQILVKSSGGSIGSTINNISTWMGG